VVRLFKSIAIGIASAAVFSLPPGETLAGSFSISPLRLELSKATPNGALTIRNGGEKPVVLQVQPMAWSQAGGDELLDETREILATPAVFTLEPGASQLLRVAMLREVDPERELSYRVIVQEVPPDEESGITGARIALRMSLPIFVLPAQPAEPDLSWSAVISPDRKASLVATNSGNAHVQIGQITLNETAGVTLANPAMAYLLPGQSRSWELEGALDAGSQLEISGISDGGPISASVEVQPE
jgi:fimbrial chaperone protein